MGRRASHFCRRCQQQPQPSLQPLLLQPQLPLQPQLLPPQEPPQQQQIRMTMMRIHRQEQLLFPLLKHMIVTSL